MTVYIITAGEYSEYHICAVFSTREKAVAALQLLCATEDDIEEYDVDEIVPFANGLLPYSVDMDWEGNTTRCQRETGQGFREYVQFSNKQYTGPVWCVFYTWARDKQHAVKIANEKRTQMIATGEWK